jgi:hypothetical protein
MLAVLAVLVYGSTSGSMAYAGDYIKIPSPDKGMDAFVSRSDIRKNLTNYRQKSQINLELVYVFSSKNASQNYKKNTPCVPMNPNDYKYVFIEIRFRFGYDEIYQMSELGYDKFDNFLCGGHSMSLISLKKSGLAPVIKRLREIFEEEDEREEVESW